jgi:putative endonuclease
VGLRPKDVALPMPKNTYFVYILANNTLMLYIGVTNSLESRVVQHKQKLVAGYTSRYNITRLLYFEEFGDIRDAIAREKQLKGWRRARKLDLARSMNPRLRDLAEDWM